MNNNLINDKETMLYVKEGGEITQEDLAKISGGQSCSSKVIDIPTGLTYCDGDF
jgi:hypothetical protein